MIKDGRVHSSKRRSQLAVTDQPAARANAEILDHTARNRLGRQGEDLAAGHLANTGCVVLSRNWRCRDGELDLVATDGERLIVVEVKTRSTTRLESPADAVTDEKAARIRRLAMRWLSAHRVGWCPVRFDVVAVDFPAAGEPSLTHIADAF